MEYTFTVQTPSGPITVVGRGASVDEARDDALAQLYLDNDGLSVGRSDLVLQSESAPTTSPTGTQGGGFGIGVQGGISEALYRLFGENPERGLPQTENPADVPYQSEPYVPANPLQSPDTYQQFLAATAGASTPTGPAPGVDPQYRPAPTSFAPTPASNYQGSGGAVPLTDTLGERHRLTAQGAFDELARAGQYNVPYRQSLNAAYGDTLDNSSLLRSIFNSAEVSRAYESGYNVTQLNQPEVNSFTNFVAGNTPQGARQAAARGVLGILDSGGVNSNNAPDLLDAISVASGYFGNAYSNVARGRLGRVYDDVQSLDVTGAVTTDSFTQSVERNLPGLLDTLRRTSIGR